MFLGMINDIDPSSVFLLLLSGVLLAFLASRRFGDNVARQTYALPPSPGIALPIIGHLHLLPKNPRKKLMEWAKRLGPVYRLQFGCETIIVLSGFDTLKEALVLKADYFSNRPDTYIMRVLGKTRGFVTSGPEFSQHRKVTMQIFRQLGFGSHVMEEKIRAEVTHFLNDLDHLKGEVADPRQLLIPRFSNIISRLAFGKGYRHQDPKMEMCARLIGEQVVLMAGLSVLNFLPFLAKLPGDLFGLRKALNISDHLENSLIKPQVATRKNGQAFREGEVEDYITGYLREIDKKQQHQQEQQQQQQTQQQQQEPNGELNADFAKDEWAITEDNLVAVVANLFAAGTETTTSALCWCMLYLLHHPEVKDRCYQDIVANIGTQNRIRAQDRYRCQYVEAFIMEVLRIASVAPFAIFHTASENVVFHDFLIPKGAAIMPSLDSVLLADDIWGDPLNFRPERFLDADTNDVIRRPEFVPFSLGRRSCLGEAMARLELFLFVTSVLQNFDIRLPDGADLPPIAEKFGMNCSPLPYKVCFWPRTNRPPMVDSHGD